MKTTFAPWQRFWARFITNRRVEPASDTPLADAWERQKAEQDAEQCASRIHSGWNANNQLPTRVSLIPTLHHSNVIPLHERKR